MSNPLKHAIVYTTCDRIHYVQAFHNYGVASEPSLPGGIGFVEYGPTSNFGRAEARPL